MTFSQRISRLGEIFGALDCTCFHHWRTGQNPPYVIWYETSTPSFESDNGSTETGMEGYVHLFTQDDADPIADSIIEAMQAAGMTFTFQGSNYEEDTNLVHMYWSWAWLS